MFNETCHKNDVVSFCTLKTDLQSPNQWMYYDVALANVASIKSSTQKRNKR